MNSRKDGILSYNTKTSEFADIPFEYKMSDNSSVCMIPNGLMISGGHNSLRKAWICMF